MRSDLLLDKNSWDLVITDDIGIVENAAMTSQDSKFSLQLIQGEVFDDTRLGVPWLTDMVNPQVSIAARKQILRDTIMRTPGAVELTSLDVAVDNQTGIASCTFEGITDNGGIFGSSVGEVDIPSVTDSGIIAEYDYITGKSFGLRLERSSEATYIKDGLLKYAGINIPRFESNGLLIEGFGVNLIRQSSGLMGSSWVTSQASKSPYSSPDGLMGAIKLSPNSSPVTHSVSQNFSSDAGRTYTFSIFVKPGELKKCIVQIGNFVSQVNPQAVRVDMAAKTAIGTVDQSRVSIIEIADGWLRVSTTATVKVSPPNNRLIAAVLATDDSWSLTPTGDGVSGFYVWGAQVEQGSQKSSLITTDKSSSARSDDQLSVIDEDAKWIYREYVPLGLVSTVKELVEYDGAISPYGHLQKLKVWNREPTAAERAALGL